MKCYFNLVSGDERLIDHEGVEVKDLDQAWVQALKAIEELRAEDDGDASDWADWSLEVADASGAVFFSIKLTASLQ